MRTIENYRTLLTLIISGINMVEKIVVGQKTNILAFELVDTFEVKDLKIDLANKKIYQLINKANNAEYLYNQVKDQYC